MNQDDNDKITTPADKETVIAENIQNHEIQDPLIRRKDS